MPKGSRSHVDVWFSAVVPDLDRNRLLVVVRALVPSVTVRRDPADGEVAARLLMTGSTVAAADLERAARRWLATATVEVGDVVVGRAGGSSVIVRRDRHTLRRQWRSASRFPRKAPPRAGTGLGPRVLMLADEWLPRLGGLSAFNRYLSIALADAGADVCCLMPEASREEHDDAAAVGVSLVAGTADAVAGLPPDAVIGHGRVTGELARTLAGTRFTSTSRLHVVHAAPDEVGWHKEIGPDPARTIEDRTHAELDLCVGAARTLAVGPRLHGWLDRDLPNLGLERPGRLDPGFDETTATGRGVPNGTPQVLVMGRMGDHLVKGLDIAARAIGHALDLRGGDDEVEFLVRGVPAGQGAELRARVAAWIGHRAVRVLPRNFTMDLTRVRADLTRATVMVMPSRAEGFGLVGLEAISVGTPALVSDRSGLGALLREVLPGELAARMVVPVVDDPVADTRIWGHAVAAVLRDRDAAFATAAVVASTMARSRTWAMAADTVMAAIRGTRAGH